MGRLKRWLGGTLAGIAALVGLHKVQPVSYETGTPPKESSLEMSLPSATPAMQGIPSIQVGNIEALPVDVEKIQKGFEYANKVLATECAHQFVIQSHFTENYQYDANGKHGLELTGGQIWNILANQPVKVNVVMFTGTRYQNYISKTIGYEDEPGTVYMNRYFVETAYDVADNLLHEGEGHSQGFSHYITSHGWPTSTNEPYGINAMFEKCAAEAGIQQ